ncbi:MAG: hypothetical protein K2M70_08155, partial [Lachnospiraceae bacterium]|nr:hypothetical protein [Lachnospiraceae bacterium]
EQYGRIITDQDTFFNRISTGARESYDLTNWLLFLAICLFVADVAMRRFQFMPKIAQEGLRGGNAKPEKASSDDSQKKREEGKKSQKRRQTEQTLDTSQLLRKKDDRSI